MSRSEILRKRGFECVHRDGPVTCQNCQKNGYDYDFHINEVQGDLVCPDCGCCIDRLFDDGPEKRNFVDGKNHSRTIEVDKFLGMMTHTTIIGKGGAHNQLQQAQLRLAPTETKRTAKLSESFKTLKNVEACVECKPCVVNTAKWYMCKLQDKLDAENKRINGTTTVEYATAFLYLASIYHEQGIPFVDMCNKAVNKSGKLSDRNKVRKFIGDFQRILGDNLEHPTPNPQTFVEQLAFNFSLDFKVTGRAFDIVNEAQNHKCTATCGKSMSGMRPSTLAAACFYRASLQLQKELNFVPLKEENIALCAGIEKGTLTAACSTLESHWKAMYPTK